MESPTRSSSDEKQAQKGESEVTDYFKLTHDHLKFDITIYKEHDHKHPMTLSLAFSPLYGDTQDLVYATCPCSTAICRGRGTWLNAYAPHVSATLTHKPLPSDEGIDLVALEYVGNNWDLSLTLDFSKHRVENSKFEDEGDVLWDANAYLQLTLTDLDFFRNSVRRGFFKNSDLVELDSCYMAIVERWVTIDVDAEECDGTGSKILLSIPVQFEGEEPREDPEARHEIETQLQARTEDESGISTS